MWNPVKDSTNTGVDLGGIREGIEDQEVCCHSG